MGYQAKWIIELIARRAATNNKYEKAKYDRLLQRAIMDLMNGELNVRYD